jgi:hypothetical protein
MKHFMTLALAVAAIIMTACNNSDSENVLDGSAVKITFNVQGDFTLSTAPMTRALTADGKQMTDVWVLDYVGGELQQQLHQTSADPDFGQPTLDLALGSHHLYFIASRGSDATLNTDAHTLSFAKVLDTFWRDYELTVTTGTSSGNRAVTLDRVVTKLKVLFTDAIPTGAATFNITPNTWYYGFDYQTGEPSAAAPSQAISVAIPSSEIGHENVFLNIFGFSGTTEWTTDVAVNCKDADNAVLGQATIPSAPFVRNRVTEYSGPLFTAGSGMTLSLNTDWTTAHTGTW